jgi:hypothetical protein
MPRLLSEESIIRYIPRLNTIYQMKEKHDVICWLQCLCGVKSGLSDYRQQARIHKGDSIKKMIESPLVTMSI